MTEVLCETRHYDVTGKRIPNTAQKDSIPISTTRLLSGLRSFLSALWLWRRLGIIAWPVFFELKLWRCNQGLWILVIHHSKVKFCWKIKINFKYKDHFKNQQEYASTKSWSKFQMIWQMKCFFFLTINDIFYIIFFKKVHILFFKLGLIEILKKKIVLFWVDEGRKKIILSIMSSWYTG